MKINLQTLQSYPGSRHFNCSTHLLITIVVGMPFSLQLSKITDYFNRYLNWPFTLIMCHSSKHLILLFPGHKHQLTVSRFHNVSNIEFIMIHLPRFCCCWDKQDILRAFTFYHSVIFFYSFSVFSLCLYLVALFEVFVKFKNVLCVMLICSCAADTQGTDETLCTAEGFSQRPHVPFKQRELRDNWFFTSVA